MHIFYIDVSYYWLILCSWKLFSYLLETWVSIYFYFISIDITFWAALSQSSHSPLIFDRPNFLDFFVLNYTYPRKSAHNVFIYGLQTMITKASSLPRDSHIPNYFLDLHNWRPCRHFKHKISKLSSTYHISHGSCFITFYLTTHAKNMEIVLDAFLIPQI